jgi:hypothetical protein
VFVVRALLPESDTVKPSELPESEVVFVVLLLVFASDVVLPELLVEVLFVAVFPESETLTPSELPEFELLVLPEFELLVDVVLVVSVWVLLPELATFSPRELPESVDVLAALVELFVLFVVLVFVLLFVTLVAVLPEFVTPSVLPESIVLVVVVESAWPTPDIAINKAPVRTEPDSNFFMNVSCGFGW